MYLVKMTGALGGGRGRTASLAWCSHFKSVAWSFLYGMVLNRVFWFPTLGDSEQYLETFLKITNPKVGALLLASFRQRSGKK
jgi:hypothetical protein